MPPPAPRALVLDEHLRQSLATVRALGKAGVEVETAGYIGPRLGGASRYSSRRHLIPSPGESTETFSRALDEIVESSRIDVVFASDDGTIEHLCAHPPRVPCVPDVRSPGLRPLIDKLELGAVAAKAGVPYPATRHVSDVASLAEAVEDVGLPVVVKPRSSASLFGGQALVSKGATIARTVDEGAPVLAKLAAGHVPAIAQEFVARLDKINVTIFRRDGRTEVAFPYRVVRDVPIGAGIAVTIETVSRDASPGADVVAALEQICDAAGYSGVVNGEFCCVEDGSIVLIETNARPWGSLWFCEQQGHRMSERCLRHALGIEALEPAPSASRPWFHHPTGEIQWALQNERKAPAFRSLARTARPGHVFEYVDLSDPRPLVNLIGDLALRRVRRRPERDPSAPARAVYRVGD